ncbi:GspH/FimT family pseudopilin [Sphingomonas sp. NCPPB 2930]
MRARGFTLVELMVVMAILVLMLLAVAPSVSAWLVNLRIRNAADALQNGLQTARNEAIRRNRPMGFWLVSAANPAVLDNACVLSAASASWVVSGSDPTGACAAAPSTTAAPMLVAAHAVGDGSAGSVAVAAVQADGSTAASAVRFNGFGQTVAGAPIARIDVRNAADPGNYRSLRIVVSGSGAIRMCDPASTVAATDPRYCGAG